MVRRADKQNFRVRFAPAQFPCRGKRGVDMSAGSAGCKLVGPCGEVELKEGVIVAKRHIHVTPEDAEKLGVADKEIVKVACGSEGRKLVFDDVVIRVSEKFATAMHIDTDESNAAGCTAATVGELIKK